MSHPTTTTVSIDTKEEFLTHVRESGVLVDGDGDEPDVQLSARGEGRQTRYGLAVGGEDFEQVAKAEIEAVYDDYGLDEVRVLVDEEHDHGDIQCEYCGALLGYVTGSHLKSHDDGGPQTVAEYRDLVAGQKGIDPEDVPLAPEELNSVFEDAGELDEETRQQLSEQNKARWEAGEYDHLRKDDGDAETDGGPEAEAAA